jgi:hypothetical protein
MKAKAAGDRKDEAQRSSNLNLSKSNIDRDAGDDYRDGDDGPSHMGRSFNSSKSNVYRAGGEGSDDPAGIAVNEEGVPEDNRPPKPN